MHENGATTDDRGGAICCEPRVWLENGIFPVEYIDGAGPAAPLDPHFVEMLDQLWRAVLREPTERTAYRRYEPLLWPGELARAFVDRLSTGALRRFLDAAGVDWQTPPREPTCDHGACHREYLFATDEWSLPPRERLRAWVTMALTARIDGQSRWPALAAPGAPGGGRAAAGRWPRPRPLPWVAGDGDAAQ